MMDAQLSSQDKGTAVEGAVAAVDARGVSARGRPLSGARGWIIADEKIGMQVQVRGVADALGLEYELKQVAPAGLTRLLAPWSRPGRAERIGQSGSLLGPPWPIVALATGRLSIP